MALFLLIAYFRMAVAIILVPAILVWYWIDHPLHRPGRYTLAAFLIVLLLTISAPPLRGPLIRLVTTEQASFLVLEGRSRLPLPALDGTLNSIWRAFPAAIRNGYFEPLPGSGGQPIYLAFSIELLVVWLTVLFAAIYTTSRPRTPRPPDGGNSLIPAYLPAPVPGTPPASAFPAACLLFALAGMLIIGFFVPFAGTIVRYRSIYLPFLLAPALHTLRHLPGIKSLNRWLKSRKRIFR
jgi:hypothetical protein